MVNIIMVIYNKYFLESITFKCLNSNLEIKRSIDEGHICIYMYDNSTSYYDNKRVLSINGIRYYSQNENIGLSKAYNYVIDRISLNSQDYIVILDDDTEITQSYLNYLYWLSYEKTDFQRDLILLPIIKSNKDNSLFSPSRFDDLFRSEKVDNIEDLKGHKITGINSGMIISSNVFAKLKYNEKMFVDYIDHDFIRRAYMEGFSTSIIENELYQSISSEEDNEAKALSRFKIFKNDYYVYCKECNKTLHYRISIFIHAIRSALKYRNISFFKYLF